MHLGTERCVVYSYLHRVRMDIIVRATYLAFLLCKIILNHSSSFIANYNFYLYEGMTKQLPKPWKRRLNEASHGVTT